MSLIRFIRFLCLQFVLFIAAASCISAQTDPDPQQGLRVYDSYNRGNIDRISTSTGALGVDIPLISYPQRGGKLKLDFALHYQNSGSFANYTCYLGHCQYVWYPRGTGFQIVDQGSMGASSISGNDHGQVWTAYDVVDATGAVHPMAPVGSNQESLDATGIELTAAGTIITPDGVRITPTGCGTTYNFTFGIGCEAHLREDTNGNQISYSSSGWVDTLGRQIPSPVTGSASSCPSGPLPVTSAQVWNLPGLSGGTYTITFCYVSVSTSIGWGKTGSYSGNYTQMQTVILPNGTAWNFQYDSLGNLSQITFPTGGTLAYSWGNFTCGSEGLVVNPVIGTRTLNSVYGYPGSNEWTYRLASCNNQTYPYTTSMVVTDPLGNDTVHNSNSLGTYILSANFYENQTLYYQGSYTTGTLLKTVNTNYSSVSAQLGNTMPTQAYEVVPTQVTTIWPTGLQSAVTFAYDSGHSFTCPDISYSGGPFTYGKLVTKKDFDYGTGAPGALLRQTLTAYMAFSGPNSSSYLANNLISLQYTSQVLDGSGTQRAYTTYAYDTSSLVASGISTQRDPNPPAGTYRGNLNSASDWLNTTGSYLTSSTTYFDTGAVDVSTDPRSNTTSYAYSSAYQGGYPTTVTNALNQSTSRTFDFNTGAITSITDTNNQVTSMQYDSMLRPTQITFADQGQISACYTDEGGTSCTKSGPPFQVVTKRLVTSSLSDTKTVVYDGLGRPIQSQFNSDPDGVDYTDKKYDGLGRVYCTSNPYRGTSDSTYGITTRIYDALGRITALQPPDFWSSSSSGSPTCQTVTPQTTPANPSNYVSTVYLANTSTVTDQAGKSRETVSDGLDRLAQLIEDPGASPHLNYHTYYSYDALDNPLCVAQQGTNSGSFSTCSSIPTSWRPRTFVYDSLSRLTSATNPESGTITYLYDADGNVTNKTSPAQNQTGSSTVTLSYCYDALNRITAKAYTQQSCSGTPPTLPSPVATYLYDQSSYNGLTISNGVGRRTGMTDQAGVEAWSYDSMGRPLIDQRTTNSVIKNTTYAYLPYVDGSVNTITYPSGRTVTYMTGTAHRLLSVQDNTTNVYYANSAHYVPPGSLSSLTNGSTIYLTQLYNSRLQPCWLYATTGTALGTSTTCTASETSPGNILDLNYNFSVGTSNNGNLSAFANNRDNTRSQNFTYDSLNRISTAQTQTSGVTIPNANCWGLTFGYDAWGNLLTSSTTGPNGCSEPVPLNVSVSSSNQVASNTVAGQTADYCYDAAGNLIYITASGANCPSSGPYQYIYDAENHLTSAGGVAYTYNGDGKRVQKSNGKLYWYGVNSTPLDETDSAGDTNNSSFYEYISFNGQRTARRDYQNNVDYYFADHLGTARVVTNSSGTILDDSDFYPFGGERDVVGPGSNNTYKFTSKERDPESALDNFGARYNSSSIGRFMSSDWSSEPAAVPYANFGDPQTLNLYSYAGNNPLRWVDPNGHMHEDCQTISTATNTDGVIHVDVLTHCKMVPDWYNYPWIIVAAVGHHINPRSIYKQLPLSPGARQFFNRFVTGRLLSNHYYDAAHRAYNRAVQRVVSRYMTTRAEAGREGEMAVDDAKELGEKIVDEPEVSEYLENLETASGKNGKEIAEDILEGEADVEEAGELLTVLGAEAAEGIEAVVEGAAESGLVPPIP